MGHEVQWKKINAAVLDAIHAGLVIKIFKSKTYRLTFDCEFEELIKSETEKSVIGGIRIRSMTLD